MTVELPEKTERDSDFAEVARRASAGGDSRNRIFRNSRAGLFVLAAMLFIAACVYATLLRPESFGSYHDDGLFVVLAKALASGEGYRVISLPTEPFQTKVPPLYPFLLSVIWRAYPHFPGNVTWMMLLSVASTVVFLALAWRYLVRQAYATGWQALIVVGLAAVNWRTIILATGVYSEMIYAVLSVLALLLAEKREEQESRLQGIALGGVLGLAFLARSSGIALILAVVAYYLVRGQWRSAVTPALACIVFVIGWLAWGYFHRPAVDSANAGYYESYLSTLSRIVSEEGSQQGSPLLAFLGFAAKNAVMLILVSVPLICLGLSYSWIQDFHGYFLGIGLCLFAMTLLFTAGGFFRFRSTGLRLLHCYVGVYLVVHIAWPYAAYDRFLMPLLPWLLVFLVGELTLIAASARRELTSKGSLAKKASACIIALFILMLCGFVSFNSGSGIRKLYSSASDRSRFLGDEEAMRWLEANTSSSDVLVCYRDPTYFLYTGRRSVRSISSREGGLSEDSPKTPEERARGILRIVAEEHARYLILTQTDFEQEDEAALQREKARELVDQNPKAFVLVFESPDGNSRIFRIEKDAL